MSSSMFKDTLYITGCTECDFVLWYPKETAVFKVEKDPSWELNVPQLEVFFKTHFLPVYLDGGL